MFEFSRRPLISHPRSAPRLLHAVDARIEPSPDRPDIGKSRRTKQDSRRTTILVVDDCADTADSLALLLTLKGHRATALYSAARLVEVARARRPDLILLDLVMPDTGGYQALEQLRSDPSFDATWVVAITGYPEAGNGRNGARASFDARLLKPVDFDALEAILRKVHRQPRDPAVRRRRTMQQRHVH